MEIVIASRNLHKIREYREMFKALSGFDILSLLDFPHYDPPQTRGTSFKENAIVKAEHAAEVLSKWVLADDAGIVIPALGKSAGRDLRFFF
jgi:XTP/dITP diphosphohydrolase